jgi:hypothetical protein
VIKLLVKVLRHVRSTHLKYFVTCCSRSLLPAGQGPRCRGGHLAHWLLAHALTHQSPRQAPTSFAGISAIGIDGVTLHSFAGCGVPRIAKEFGTMFSKENYAKWRKLQVLIVDEISMVQVIAALAAPALSVTVSFLPSLQAEFIDWLDLNVRRIREEPDRPFGGVQLVFAGGF